MLEWGFGLGSYKTQPPDANFSLAQPRRAVPLRTRFGGTHAGTFLHEPLQGDPRGAAPPPQGTASALTHAEPLPLGSRPPLPGPAPVVIQRRQRPPVAPREGGRMQLQLPRVHRRSQRYGRGRPSRRQRSQRRQKPQAAPGLSGERRRSGLKGERGAGQ